MIFKKAEKKIGNQGQSKEQLIHHVIHLINEANTKKGEETLWAEKFFNDARHTMHNNNICLSQLPEGSRETYKALQVEIPLGVARYYLAEARREESSVASLSEMLDKLTEAGHEDNFAMIGSSEEEFNTLLFKGYKYYARFRMGRALEAFEQHQWTEFIQWAEAAVKYMELANVTIRKNNSFERVSYEMIGADKHDLETMLGKAARSIAVNRLSFLHENPVPSSKVDEILIRLNNLLHRYKQSFHDIGITLNDITTLRMQARWNDWNTAMRTGNKDAAKELSAEMHEISSGRDVLFLVSDKKAEFVEEQAQQETNNVIVMPLFGRNRRA